MKIFTRPNSFYEALTSVHYFNYVLGLRVFEYPRGHPRPLLSLIYFLIIYVIFYSGVLNVERYYNTIKIFKLDSVIYVVVPNIYFTSPILKMILGWWFSKNIAVCHKKIFKIDKTLRQLGLTANYDKIYFMTLGFITTWFIVYIFICISNILYIVPRIGILQTIHVLFVSIIPLSIGYVNSYEFYAFSRLLHIKFKLINHLLRETIKNLSVKETKLSTFELKDYTKLMDFEQQKNILSMKIISEWHQSIYSASNFVIRNQSPVDSQIEIYIPFQIKKELQNKFRNRFHENISTTKRENHVHILQITKQVHLELCKISRIICSAFGVQIFWEIGMDIMFSIQTLYTLYNQYIQELLKVAIEHSLVALTLCIFNIFVMFLLSCTCKNAAEEGNKTVELIHTTYGYNTDIDTQEEMQQFRIQILHRPVTFYVFGLTMDNHILSMMLSTVTNYMVIIIQENNTLESKSDLKNTHF
ncbi:hypothetical protein PUN28_010455 [Cardiocondyla obscurior]|uniref:Gustatory receptor n=2 Tax=Cardiocondyla obscurior TaxID=286306 RepID=A0AAW2FG55_9HYME